MAASMQPDANEGIRSISSIALTPGLKAHRLTDEPCGSGSAGYEILTSPTEEGTL